MHVVLKLVGNLLLTSSVLSALGLGVMMLLPDAPDSVVPSLASQAPPVALGFTPHAPTHRGDRRLRVMDAVAADAPLSSDRSSGAAAEDGLPIAHLAIPSINLSVDVVTADLIERNGAWTWTVPSFKVGHAAGTAGAGQTGTALLLGHVESVHSGNVFASLDRVAMGDTVSVTSDDDRAFDYRVVSIARVPRDDTSTFAPTEVPSLSMVTCAGIWLPTTWDFSERLIVRAELAQPR